MLIQKRTNRIIYGFCVVLMVLAGTFVGKNLSEREKEILLMCYYVGKTQMEVSNEVGISQAQVSRLEKNALDAIKKHLSE